MTETSVLRNIETELRDIRDRVIRIEAAGVDRQVAANTAKIEKLELAVRKLEDSESRREGAKGMLEWLARNGPGLAMLAIAVVAGMLLSHWGK